MKNLFVELSDGGRWYPGRKDNKVSIEVLAHSLSSLSRFTGHARWLHGYPYTVAEHSVKVSLIVPTLTALLHDAQEAITNDLSKPIKVFIGGSYKDLETETEKRMAALFGLDQPHNSAVKHADILMVLIESFDLLPSKGKDWGYFQEYREEAMELYVTRPELRPACWPPTLAYKTFMDRYDELRGYF